MIVSSILIRPTPRGSLNRLGPADPGLNSGVGERPHAILRLGQFIRLLHLPENLGFANHHAIEAGGHGEQMPHEILAGVFK